MSWNLPRKSARKSTYEKVSFSLPVHFGEFFLAVVGDFEFGGAAGEGGVPRAAIGGVEAIAERAGVGEGGVDDVRVRDAEDEFVDADAGEAAGFADEAIVGGAFEFVEGAQVGGVISEAGENAFVALDVFGRDEAVCGIAAKLGDFWQSGHF